MANGEKEKSIEMRLAAIEDKLSQMHVSEDEMKAYEKVAGLMGGPQPQPPGGGGTTAFPQILRNRFIIPRQIIRDCYECGGDCWGGPGGPFGSGGGGNFGNFG